MFKNVSFDNKEAKIYTKEHEIALKAERIMNNYKSRFSKREYNKKLVELFHFLTYLDIYEPNIDEESIMPHEPGDFKIIQKEKEKLYEIVTVFGDKEAREVDSLIRFILSIDADSDNAFEYSVMDVDKLASLFHRVLKDKKSKPYFTDYKDVTLLLVTSEHNACGSVPWYLANSIEESAKIFIETTNSPIKILNYYRSGKNSDPVISDLEDEIKQYRTDFNL